MEPEKLKGIIDFAIDKEQEAIDFYNGLAERVKSDAVAAELRRLAQMELGHKTKLQNINPESFAAVQAPQVEDLKIADYTVEAIPHSEMTWPDILNIAMHREMAAAKLYRDLAASVGDPQVKQLFENLAGEEMKHKLYLESVWDQDVMKEN